MGYKNITLIKEPFSIEYILSGGIAGFMDKATIKSTGEFVYIMGDKIIAEGVIDKSGVNTIRKYAILDNNFKYKRSVSDETVGYPDMLTEELTVKLKDTVGTSKESKEIIKLINKYKDKFKK
ncbi:MAG: hypothetical protein H7Y18_13430 [Clostridiaceae bacterium]|nr:hypothetical protein [Clostridiaceae bacterium]